MQKDRVYLVSAPAEEECSQVGDADYGDRSIRECRAYIAAIKKVCGEPPEGATLRIVRQSHDFGSYVEAACEFDADNEAAANYAFMCESKAPVTWEAAGMEAPVAARGRGR